MKFNITNTSSSGGINVFTVDGANHREAAIKAALVLNPQYKTISVMRITGNEDKDGWFQPYFLSTDPRARKDHNVGFEFRVEEVKE